LTQIASSPAALNDPKVFSSLVFLPVIPMLFVSHSYIQGYWNTLHGFGLPVVSLGLLAWGLKLQDKL